MLETRAAWGRPGLVGLALLGVAAGCGRPSADARRTIDAFVGAVQAEDVSRLYCLLAGAAQSEELGTDEAGRREGFRAWVEDRIQGYDEGRDAGWVEPQDDGVGLVKLLALGRGTFYAVTHVDSLGQGAVRARMELRFGYPSIDLSGFPPGTTLYLAGAPPGRVQVVRVPERGEVRARVLESVDLDWVLVPNADEGCGSALAIVSVRAVPESVREEDVVWTF